MMRVAQPAGTLGPPEAVRAGGKALAARWLRGSEALALAYLLYAAAFALPHSATSGEWARRGAAVGVGAAVVLALAWMDARTGSLVTSCACDWLPPALILLCYRAADWYPHPAGPTRFDLAWIGLDRTLLHRWGGQAAIESLGPVLPFLLELCYCLLYAVTPFAVALLYLSRRRRRVDLFLSTLLAGTLTTYALLPHFPSAGPRAAFPGQDLPGYFTPFRLVNLWILDHFDIRTSVFPSGHVTLGFSAAFGMLLALPERRWAGVGLLVLAAGVLMATIYGRYHYAVDGLAGLAVSLGALAAACLFGRGRTS